VTKLSEEAQLKLGYELKRLQQIEREQVENVSILNDAVQPYYAAIDRLRQSGIQTHNCARHTTLLPDNSNYRVLGKAYVVQFRPDTALLRRDIFSQLDQLAVTWGPLLNEKKTAATELKIIRHEVKAVWAQLNPKKRKRESNDYDQDC
jgi:hypothetical protein